MKIVGSHTMIMPAQGEKGAEVTTVLTKSPCGCYAAYRGIGSLPWIAQNGVKLSSLEAAMYFPWAPEGLYRG